jgi:hypothetical protein
MLEYHEKTYGILYTKMKALFSDVTEAKLHSDNCILQKSNPIVAESEKHILQLLHSKDNLLKIFLVKMFRIFQPFSYYRLKLI